MCVLSSLPVFLPVLRALRVLCQGLPPGEVGPQLSELELSVPAVLALFLACVWMDLMEMLGCQMQKERKTTFR